MVLLREEKVTAGMRIVSHIGILENPASFTVFCVFTVCSTISLCDCHHTNLGYWSAIFRGIECSNHIDFNNLLIRPVSPVLGVMMEGV